MADITKITVGLDTYNIRDANAIHTSDIVQTTGERETAVMSQKAATDELETVNQKISRNSKRITNLEQGVADQFETDSSVAYAKDVPSNALPYAEIKSIGGMTYKDGETLKSAPVTSVESVGVNLFDKSKVNGATSTDTGFSFTNTSGDGSPSYIGQLKNLAPQVKVGDRITFYSDCVNAVISNGFFHLVGTATDWNAGDFISVTENDLNGYVLAYGITGKVCEYKNMIITKIANTPYTPYQKHTLPIPAEVQALDGYGEGISADCHNYIDWDKKQFVKRVGKVDMGTLNWEYSNTYFYAPVNGMPRGGAVLCAPYRKADNSSDLIATDKSILAYYSHYENAVNVHDSAYTDVATFKAAMSGVTLCYELATPEVTDISDLITEDNFIKVEGNGTLTFANEYGYDVPSEIEYQVEV